MPKDDALAEAAATLYAMNPANVFYGSAYTEAGFAYAQFVAGTMLQENKMLASGVAFGVATMFRSNGVLCVVPLLAPRRARGVSVVAKRGRRDAASTRGAAREAGDARGRARHRAALRVCAFWGHAILQTARYLNGAERPVLSPEVVAYSVRARPERDVLMHSEALLEI